MNAFTGAYVLPPDALARVAVEARTPMSFEWPGVAYKAITHRGVHVVYILGFQGGIVKVGQTIDFLTRLSANRSSPRRRGSKLVCGWRVASDNPLDDEAVLKRLAAELGGTRMGRSQEWFTGLDVRELIEAGESALLTEAQVAA